MKKQILLWGLAVLITLASAVYQRMTGPTHPYRGDVTFEGQTYSYKFERTHEGSDDHNVSIEIKDQSVSGVLVYKRFKSNDIFTEVPMQRNGNILSAKFPGQPAAGKVQYYVRLFKGVSFVNVPEANVILRFRGYVPDFILIPHIFVMFGAMLLSTRTGLEMLSKNAKPKLLVILTFIFVVLGGLVLGPLVLKYAFNEYWGGIPFGMDLTDNKTLVAFIVWLVALIAMLKGKREKLLVLVASIVMFIVFLIPHSVLGSEIDYTKVETQKVAPLNK